MSGKKMNPLPTPKNSVIPRLGQVSTMSICTKDKKTRYVIPSVFALPTAENLPNRKQLRVANFAKVVNEHIEASKLNVADERLRFPASVRHAIISMVCKLRSNPRVHFDGKEIAMILQIYYAITGHKVRLMTPTEFEGFLQNFLGITDSHVLSGFKRVALYFSDGSKRIERVGILPENFVLLLSMYLRGSVTERAEIAFKVMDIDRDGILTKQLEFRRFLAGSFDPEIAATHADIDPDQPVRESIQYLENLLVPGSETGVDIDRFKEMAEKQPWLIDCLLPISCKEANNFAFQYLLSTSSYSRFSKNT